MGDDTKVVGLRGAIVPQTMGADPRLIKMLEDILERARSGEIVGVSAVVQHSDECCGWHRAGLLSYRLLGFATGMVAEMANELNKS